MAKDKKDKTPAEPVDPSARYEVSDADKAKAKKWFVRAAELVETKSMDFAIKCYWDGLGLWVEAVTEAHMPLRAAACMRNLTGGKKLGFTEAMKFPASGKDAKKALLNAEWLLSHDPFNITHMEGVLKNAGKLRAEDTLSWIAPIYSNAIEGEKKLSPKRFALLREVLEEAGDRAAKRGEATLAVACFEQAAQALRVQRHTDTKDLTLENELRDLSTKLTILKGKYETADTYQESIRDAEQQKDTQDRERMVQAEDSLERLANKAKREMDENPGNPTKVNNYVELLCRQENEDNERLAIKVLVEQYKEHRDYRFKQKAEDIRIKQMKRAVRKARAGDDQESTKKLRIELLTFELKAYRERVKQYPTDNRIKFLYATRLKQSGKLDDAIPMFQAARADAKVRVEADLHLGRCFYEMKFYAQAVGTLSKAVESYEISDNTTGKDLRYWLARSMEADGRLTEAGEAYGLVLELDYNFRDVRDRLQGLRTQGDGGP